jgi:hypothetical protein
MNDEPHPAIRVASRTLRPIGNVTVWIITAVAIAACSSDQSDDPAAATISENQAATTSAPSPAATPTTLQTTTSPLHPPRRPVTTPVRMTSPSPTPCRTVGKRPTAGRSSSRAVIPVFGVAFWDVTNIFVDPCKWVPFDPPVGPSVDELASAWAKLRAVEVNFDERRHCRRVRRKRGRVHGPRL